MLSKIRLSSNILNTFRGTHVRMSSNFIKVEVNQGVVIGQKEQTPNGTKFNSFRGVPYALPPIGELRFKSPVPIERFETPEIDCRRERDISFQRDPFTQVVIGSENSLFLNVYAPRLKTARPLPVLVWIHGGGFMFGNGNSDYYFPQAFMDEEVIVVTLNYRLGALGFLCLPEAGVWGNAGLKDQRLALQWINENIERFNGDSNNVTLFGESAGGASVHLHSYARHANKLFHKAILQSGSANMEWVFQPNPIYKSHRLAEILKCKSNNPNEILIHLQSKAITSLDILTNAMAVLTADERRRGLPLPFKPVVEQNDSPDSFIDELILDKLKKPNILNEIPIMMGYNTAEGIAMMTNAVRKMPQYDQDLARLVPRNIPLEPDDAAIQVIAKKMRNFYLNGQKLTKTRLNGLVDMLSDYHFTVDMQKAAELHVRYQPYSPLYFYCFDYIGDRNLYKRIFQMDHLKGACHGDELFYLFQMADIKDAQQLSANDALMVKRLCRLWSNFARYGQPTPNGIETPIIDCVWQAVQRPQDENERFLLNYLYIGDRCEMRIDLDRERMEFWNDIYNTLPPNDYSKLSSKL